jgi:hypothetical protein
MCESLEVNKQTHTHIMWFCAPNNPHHLAHKLPPNTTIYIGGDYVIIGDEIELWRIA